MSGFFSGLANIQKPDVIWNQGPLPSQRLPSPWNAHTDARINYNSALLGNIKPYTYAEPSHLQDQTAYWAIPHKIQKIIPELSLPEARDTETTFVLSHGVDSGDFAFSLRINRSATTLQSMQTFDKLQLNHVVDPMINLQTVNYLLAGIQRNWNMQHRHKWQQFMVDVEFLPQSTAAKSDFTVKDAIRFITDVAKPFGIVIGSDKQGGQHEGSTKPVTFPVNFITTIAVCGRVENITNMWREHDMSNGDDLIFYLEYLPICSQDNSMEYVLNHWRKNFVRQTFDWDSKTGRNFAWQLVPGIYSAHKREHVKEQYDYRENGYWHVCRTQQMRAAEITQKMESQSKVQACYHDDSRFMRGGLLECTVEPVFVRHRSVQLKNNKHAAGSFVQPKSTVMESKAKEDEAVPKPRRRRIHPPPTTDSLQNASV